MEVHVQDPLRLSVANLSQGLEPRLTHPNDGEESDSIDGLSDDFSDEDQASVPRRKPKRTRPSRGKSITGHLKYLGRDRMRPSQCGMVIVTFVAIFVPSAFAVSLV